MEGETKKKRRLPRLSYNAPAVLTFAILALIVLAAAKITDGGSTRLLFSVYRFSPADFFGYLRLFGHVLGHSNFAHLAGNFTLILVVGPMLEEKYGSLRIVCMMLVTALITSLVIILFFPGTALCGASGVAFMLILLSAFVNIRAGEIPVTLPVLVVIYLIPQIRDGISRYDNVSQLGHIIGGLCGAAFGFALSYKKPAPPEDGKE